MSSSYEVASVDAVDATNENTPASNVFIINLVVMDLEEIDRNTETRKAFAEYIRLKCEEALSWG
jgi:hypothetical protein